MKPAIIPIALVFVALAHASPPSPPTSAPVALTTGPDDPIESPPDNLKQSFYTKCAYFQGMPILSNAKVDDRAFHKLIDVFGKELANCDPRVMPTMVKSGVHYSIISATDGQTLLPELADLRNDPKIDWDKRGRGMGGRDSSAGEENILEFPSDRYRGESIYIHEFAHTLDRYAFTALDPNFARDLRAAYKHAKTTGLWTNTYSITNQSEYFAEGVQMYFDCARGGNPADGVHNEIINREGLQKYDVDLFNLIDREFGKNPWRYEGKYCTTGKKYSFGVKPRN